MESHSMNPSQCYTCPGYIPDPANYLSNHMRYRYYYDPPELLTCIISIRDHWHVGLFCDYPHETRKLLNILPFFGL